MRVVAFILLCAAPLPAASPGYTGAQACAACHPRIYRTQAASHHARALRPIRGSELEQLLKAKPIGERGGYRLEYADAPSGLRVTARGTGDQETGILEWAFGTGQVGMTPVGRYADGQYFEHRVSYYAEAESIGITPGQPLRASASATQALGLLQKGYDIYQCFRCHSTAMKERVPGAVTLDFDGMQPGVQCERCHGPGRTHVEAAMNGRPRVEIAQAIMNPARLPGTLSLQLCGECHRLPNPDRPDPEPERVEAIAVRFQPMGLLASRCFKEGKTLTCLTCHDAHTNAVRNDAAYYSSKCSSCHALPTRNTSACPRAQNSNCLPCHMRRSSPFPHLTFTDHRIRIYRP